VRSYLKKKPSPKKASGVAQGIGPEFKPQYNTTKKSWDLHLNGKKLNTVVNA
jgi:hypothetical protein